MVVLGIFIVPLYYSFMEELYFQLLLAHKLNIGLVLKFKEEACQFGVAGYVRNHPAAFYKIVLNANESIKLERNLKMLAFGECGEVDLELGTVISDNLEDFFKLVRDKLLSPLHIGTCKLGGLLPLVFDRATK
jgi:hypothetical protein